MRGLENIVIMGAKFAFHAGHSLEDQSTQVTTHPISVQNNPRVKSGLKHGNPVSIVDIKDALMRV